MKSLLIFLLSGASAYNIQPKPVVSRRNFGCAIVSGCVAATSALVPPSVAFQGSGSSAMAGYNPSSKAEKVKKYRNRVVADVRDFNALGQAIAKGETQGSAWTNFFIEYQRLEADSVGRFYAGLVDLRGVPTSKKYEYEGGSGILLAKSMTKPGKPPENTPAVKSWNKLFKAFDIIAVAGKKEDVGRAKEEWDKTKVLLEQYLSDVDLPSDLNDPIYK